MKNQKTVQIDIDLFLTLYKLVCGFLENGEEIPIEILKTASEGLQSKLEAIIKRDLYSKYKSKTLTAAERDTARQEYLEAVGVPTDFRW